MSENLQLSMNEQLLALKNESLKISEIRDFANQMVSEQGRTLRKISVIQDIVKDLINGKIHSKLINQELILQIIKDIKSSGYKIETFENSKKINLIDFLLNSKVDAIYLAPRLIISIFIPVLDKKTYTLYKLHSFENPQGSQNISSGSAYIPPSFDYLGLGSDLQHFFKANELTLKECKKIRHSTVCFNNLLLQKVQVKTVSSTY